MRWKSVRIRLMLWNMAVLSVVLIGFAAAVGFSVRAGHASAVDRDLVVQAHRSRAVWVQHHFGPSRAPGGGSGDFLVFQHAMPSHFQAVPDAPGPPVVVGVPLPPDFRGAKIVLLDPRAAPKEPSGETWDPHAIAEAAGGQERFSVAVVQDEPVRVFSCPILMGDRVKGVVQVAQPLAEQRRLDAGILRTMILLLPAALLLAAVGGWWLTDRALRPVREMTREAAQIGAEDLTRRLAVSGEDEFSDLARTFNGLIGRVEQAFGGLRLAYEQQRRFTSDASHELRTPLTTIKANTSLALAGERTAAEYREALSAADQAADLMTRIVQDLLLLARSDAGQLQLDCNPTPLKPLLLGAIDLARRPATAPVQLVLPDGPLAVRGDPHHLTRLVVNLLENALRHTPPEGRISLTAREASERVTLEVGDTGEGIPPEHLARVCDRFYRVDAARGRAHGGTGLGLAICKSIAEGHGGTLAVRSLPGSGTTVLVTLPKAPLTCEASPRGATA